MNPIMINETIDHHHHQSIIDDYSTFNGNSSCYPSYNNNIPNEYNSMELSSSTKSDNGSIQSTVNNNNHHLNDNSSLSLYENDISFDDCIDESLNDCSNMSGSNLSGENCYNNGVGGYSSSNNNHNNNQCNNKKRKANNSKNYIGKQNLFQEFQSNDVAKIRDSENKYIIG